MVFNDERTVEKIDDPRRCGRQKHFFREKPGMHGKAGSGPEAANARSSV